MTDDRTALPPPPASRRRVSDRLLLGLAVALSAVPLIVLSRTEGLGFDGFWHLFIARQDDWRVLLDEAGNTAHPPLFFLCLKAAVAILGTGPFAYRLVSTLGTIVSTWWVGRIVQRATGRRWLPAAAALAFGSSLTVTTIGLEVRSYALATALMLGAYLAFIELVDGGLVAPRHRARPLFALTSSLALLTHYGTAPFLLSSIPALLILALVDPELRRRLLAVGWRQRWANLATFGVPLVVLAIANSVHISDWSNRPLLHLPAFLFDPRREGALEFLWRNTRALFELFLPPLSYQPAASTHDVAGPELPAGAAALLAIGVLVAVAWLVCGGRRDEATDLARRVPPTLLASSTAMVIALALLGRYPYGGMLRHQYFLFPLGMIVLALLLDAIARRAPARIRGLAVGLLALAGLLNAVNWLTHLDPTRFNPHPHQVRRFYASTGAPETVFVDRFNSLLLFMHHHEQEWRFVRRVRGKGARFEIWWLDDGRAGGTYVCRDRWQWLLDLTRPATYERMSHCLDATGADRLAVFRAQQWETTARWPVERTRELATPPARAAGLVPEKVVVRGQDVYAVFARPAMLAAPP